MKSVSVIIPNYNGATLLAENLPLVFETLRSNDEVIVIDDNSTDNSLRFLQDKYFLTEVPEKSTKDYKTYYALVQYQKKTIDLTVVRNAVNLRFAANVNRAVSLAKNDLLFLLNSDVQPHPDVLQHLLPHFEDPTVFAVGCSENEKTSNNQQVTSGKNVLRFERGMFMHNRAAKMDSGETAWVSGGSGLFDKEKWNVLGGFDIAYSPAYWEDVDLSFRARERGWKVLFESKAKVDHNHETTNSSTFGSTKIEEMSWKNANYFTLKNSTWLQKLQYLIWKPYWSWKMGKKF